jgi:hypothetical protein
MRRLNTILIFLTLIFMSACASVPMESAGLDKEKKQFAIPSEGKSGLYIYRNSSLGGALKKTVSIDGVVIGETASNTYFYKEVMPGTHEIATESEFSDNKIVVEFKKGVNYFIQQYIKIGIFVGGAGLKLVDEDEGKKGVLQTNLAQESPNVGSQ